MAGRSLVSRLIWMLASSMAGLWLLGSVAAGVLTVFEINERLDNAIEEVAQRLRAYNGLDADVVHPPSTLPGLHEGPFTHLLAPGRLHPWKRVDLAIRAMRFVKAPVKLVIEVK